jgi:hypothetical protein
VLGQVSSGVLARLGLLIGAVVSCLDSWLATPFERAFPAVVAQRLVRRPTKNGIANSTAIRRCHVLSRRLNRNDGALSARIEVAAYGEYRSRLETLSIELHPDAILFRTRTRAVYGREPLAHDFGAVRALAFPGDKRRLMDMRRSGVVEAVAGDAGSVALAAKLATSIGRSNTLHKTYAPVDIEASGTQMQLA